MSDIDFAIPDIDWDTLLKQSDTPNTNKEALQRVLKELEAGVNYLSNDQWVSGQLSVEKALGSLLLALKKMGVNPNQALLRSIQQLQQKSETKKTNPTYQQGEGFYIYPDRVELKAEGKTQGEWPLYSQEDYDNFTQLAYELGYPIVHYDAKQLELL